MEQLRDIRLICYVAQGFPQKYAGKTMMKLSPQLLDLNH